MNAVSLALAPSLDGFGTQLRYEEVFWPGGAAWPS